MTRIADLPGFTPAEEDLDLDPPRPAPKLTEAIVTELLRDRHAKAGNGGAGEHAFLAQVRNAAGFDSNRSFDAVAMNLWPSRGLSIEIFEIKVSRSDWLRELKKPDKAEDACRLAEKFTIVAPAGCVHDGELPPTWGLIEIRGDGTDGKPWKLRTVTVAPLLHQDPDRVKTVPRGFVVGMLRCAPGAVPGGKVLSAAEREIQTARNAGISEGIEQGKRIAGNERLRQLETEAAESWRKVQRALLAAGARGMGPIDGLLVEHAADIAKVFAGVEAEDRIERLAADLERMAANLRKTATS